MYLLRRPVARDEEVAIESVRQSSVITLARATWWPVAALQGPVIARAIGPRRSKIAEPFR